MVHREDPERRRARRNRLPEVPERGMQRAAHRGAEAGRYRYVVPGTGAEGAGSIQRNGP